MDWNHLHQGDCVKGLQELEAGSVDLVFADPPFNIGYEYDVYDDRCEADHYLAWTRQWGQAVHRVLKPTGTFWLAIGDEYAAEMKLLFRKELGFTCRSWVIWYYTFGVNCTKKFSRSHAHLFHFVKDPRNFTFNNLEIRVPSARQLVYADARADSRGRLPDDTWILRPQDLPDGFRPDEDTWYFRRVCGTFKERAGWHGCQMPEQLLGRIIRACSHPHDVVLDPFAGSGTTLVVAKKLGRRWIGFELSPNYAERIRARLEAASEGQPLEGAETPQAGAPPTPRAGHGAQERPSSQRKDPAEIRRGIIEAFITVRDRFSADRVIADPELNDRFLEVCRRLGLPGEPGSWNRGLMNLRKAGHFKGLPRSHTSGLSRDEIDQCGYACEIALQSLRERELTLDSVLCEPREAAEFDRLVRSMVPDEVSSFRIRWVALHIRKLAAKGRDYARGLACFQSLPRKGELASELDWDRIPPEPGLYWLESPERKLYVGVTLNLQDRLIRQIKTSRFDFWGTERHHLEVRYCQLPGDDEKVLLGNQSHWVARWKPLGNFLKFAAL